jgi:hypothetical protein
MIRMINVSTKQTCNQEWEMTKSILAPHQQALSYLKGFYEKPHQIAAYTRVDKVPLSLGKRGSSHAEQAMLHILVVVGQERLKNI